MLPNMPLLAAQIEAAIASLTRVMEEAMRASAVERAGSRDELPTGRSMTALNSKTDAFGCNRKNSGASARQRYYESTAGTNRLSSRESEVLHWLAYGKTGPEIAIILGISTCTVRIHIQSVKRKLGAVNIPHAVYVAFARGILKL